MEERPEAAFFWKRAALWQFCRVWLTDSGVRLDAACAAIVI